MSRCMRGWSGEGVVDGEEGVGGCVDGGGGGEGGGGEGVDVDGGGGGGALMICVMGMKSLGVGEWR